MIKFTRNLGRRVLQWFLGEPQQPKVYHMSTHIDPISPERYEHLRRRKAVIEPMITKLNTYAYSSAAGIATTNVLDALKAAQTELILIDLEMEVLAEYFEKIASRPKTQIAPQQ